VKLLDRLFGGRLAPSWEVTPGATLWKLEVTPKGRLIGEARDLEAKRMSLFGVDLEEGSLLFNRLELDEPWWVALDAVIGEIAIAHHYPKPDMPSQLGATAIDVADGAILWRDQSLRVVCGSSEILLAERGGPSVASDFVFVDARTGTVLETADDERAQLFQQACDDTARWRGWISAEPIEESDPLYATLAPLLDRLLDDRRGLPEVATHGRFTVVSTYARSRRSADAMLQGQIDNVLLVIEDDRVAYRETIASGLLAATTDSFFIRNGVLFFIRNGRTLVAVRLDA
jgi:hypothetical protein